MTYGHVTTDIRRALGWLLKHEPPSDDGTAETVARYRDVVVAFCSETLEATVTGFRPGKLAHDLVWAPAAVLKDTLADTVASQNGPRLLDIVNSHPRTDYLEHWHAAARAAVDGERNVPLLETAPLNQQWAAVKDTADTLRGIAALDTICEHIPGYQPLPSRHLIATAAIATSRQASEGPLDYRVDAHGYQATTTTEPVTGSGLQAAAAAQRNVAVHLQALPSARTLRHLLVVQFDISHTAATAVDEAAGDTDHAEFFTARAGAYRELIAAARSVDGLAGGARGAVPSSCQALAALRPASRTYAASEAQQLVTACTRIDTRVVASIDRGLHIGVYLLPDRMRLAQTPVAGVHRAEPQWRPAVHGGNGSTEKVALQEVAHTTLMTQHRRPPSAMPTQQKPVADSGRIRFEESLTQHFARPSAPGYLR